MSDRKRISFRLIPLRWMRCVVGLAWCCWWSSYGSATEC